MIFLSNEHIHLLCKGRKAIIDSVTHLKEESLSQSYSELINGKSVDPKDHHNELCHYLLEIEELIEMEISSSNASELIKWCNSPAVRATINTELYMRS